MALRGSCHCGAVGYEVVRLGGPIVLCHCVTCRKTHASAFVPKVRVAREDFRWLRGEAVLRAYEFSPGKRRHFCGTCGAHLMAERQAQPHVILRAGTLDDDPGQWPALEIWTSHDVPWLLPEADVPPP